MGIKSSIKNYIFRYNKIKELNNKYVEKTIQPLINFNKKDIKFLQFTNTKVSIIIPYYNQINYTWNCLYYINKNINKNIEFEIILIDDNSSENNDLNIIEGIKIFRNKENKGFLKNINIGINASLSEYIYILNNDTEVQEGFLDELFYVFDNFKNVGAVGSKLINSDGTLQEAGSVFLKNCEIHNISARKKMFYPEVNFIKKVDYCSGCSLLFKRKNDNGEINLFDEQFSPAYFEETDLCFQLKNIQKKEIYYSPFSRVIHFNGISYNTKETNNLNNSSSKELLFKNNLVKFKLKWEKEINAIQSNNIENRISELYNNQSIVIFVGSIPEYDRDSGSNRLKEIIQAFIDLGFLVTIIKKRNYIGENNYIQYYQKMGVNIFYEHSFKITLEQYLKNNFSNASFAWFYNPTVFKTYCGIAKKYLPNTKLVYDMVDIHHLRFERALELEPKNKLFLKEFAEYKKIELEASKNADYVITISEQEKKYMQKFCEEKKLITISNIHYKKLNINETLSFENRKDILFIGSIHTPNIDALYFLYNDIMPIVWNKIPDLKVNIIGNVNEIIKDINHPNFVFCGYVPDVTTHFISNKFMIAPLRYGAGVKGKIGQAFEYYLPVVMTSIGAEGMNLKNGFNALIEDEKNEIANSIINLYTNKNLWLTLQSNSEKSLEPFSKNNLQNQINKILNKQND